MNDRTSFLNAILADPEDDAPRLVFADWLDEAGHADEAELIRVQCELEPVREVRGRERVDNLLVREHELCRMVSHQQREARMRSFGERSHDVRIVYRRGLPDAVALPVQWFIDNDDVRLSWPTITRAVLFRVNGWGTRLAACPHLAGLRGLEIACWVDNRDIAALFDSPHLTELRTLRVWVYEGSSEEAVRKLLQNVSRLPALCEVQVVWTDAEFADRPGEPRIVGVNPWKRLFAFAPGGYGGFDAHFPGRLPDGSQVFGLLPEPGSDRMPSAVYDPAGKLLAVREVVLPTELVRQAEAMSDWVDLTSEIAEHLRTTLGHRPGLIRVEELPQSWPFLVGNCPRHLENCLNREDDPELSPEDDREDGPGGNGGRLVDWISENRFTLYAGNVWYVNGITGDVEST